LKNWESLAIEADKIKAEFGIENVKIEISENNIIGTEKVVQTKTRIGQNFFRKSILVSYNSTCCITGLDIPELLRASHIKPWADSEPEEKVSPQNGLLLNSLHDSAFDKGLITINFDYEIVISEKIKQSENPAAVEYLQKFSGVKINLPSRFFPKKEFIEYHNDVIFGGL
jgi:putative restriction endonuclease